MGSPENTVELEEMGMRKQAKFQIGSLWELAPMKVHERLPLFVLIPATRLTEPSHRKKLHSGGELCNSQPFCQPSCDTPTPASTVEARSRYRSVSRW